MTLPSSRPLDVVGQVTLTVDKQEVLISGEGHTIRVDFPTLALGFKMLRQLRQQPGFNRALDTVNGFARQADVAVTLAVRGEPVGSFDRNRTPTLLSRVLGLPHIELDLPTVLRLIFSRA